MLTEKLTDKEKELLVITMEECGEFTSACSKLLRFGGDAELLDSLLQEAGDIGCMLTLLLDYGFFEDDQLQQAIQNKFDKLKQWSTLVDNYSNSVH
jgi:NTP pyrophosphatase (non-canonical NTP hydrolase)